MAAAAILNFTKSGILGSVCPRIVTIYLRTNCDGNIFFGHQDMVENPNLTWCKSVQKWLRYT